jgi:cell division protein FtsL
MIRWLLFSFLLASLLATAIAVVTLRHESRQLFAVLQQAESERDRIQVEWSRLQLEQASLSELGEIEIQAREQLGMQQPDRVGVLVESR